MLPKVVARLKKGSRDDALMEFTARRPPFADRDLYVVCVDAKGVVTAHGAFPTYVGGTHFFKDADGKVMAPEIWKAATKGDGTVRYTVKDEETNNVAEPKIGFFKKVKNDVCGVVAYGG